MQQIVTECKKKQILLICEIPVKNVFIWNDLYLLTMCRSDFDHSFFYPEDESSIVWPIGPGPIKFWQLVWPGATPKLLRQHAQALLIWTHNYMCDQILAMTTLGGAWEKMFFFVGKILAQ